jgi:hypothetical protein
MTKEQMEVILFDLEKRSTSYHEAKDLEGFLSTIDNSNPAYHWDWKREFSQLTIHTKLKELVAREEALIWKRQHHLKRV